MRKQFQSHLSRLTFGVMKRSLSVYESFDLPVISTTRPFEFYRMALFDNDSETKLKLQLQGQTLIDIGCGLTPYIEDSMYQWCRHHAIPFYAVDPKIKEGFKFGKLDRLKSLATGAKTKPNPNIGGLDKTIAAFANDLPFEDQSIDQILCCWLLFAWIRSEESLLDIFSEFDRILKPGGCIRLFPTPHWEQLSKLYPDLYATLSDYEKNQRFMFRYDLGSVPPSYRTLLTKPKN